MEISISNTPLIISCVIFVVITALHLVTVLIDKSFTKWLSYLNIVLHVCLVFTLLSAGATIDVAILWFMVSLFIYTLTYYINYTVKKKKAAKEPQTAEVVDTAETTETIETEPEIADETKAETDSDSTAEDEKGETL